MKRILFLVVALLILVGSVQAASVPGTSDPENYPVVWTESVYNNSGSALTSGTVVVWDFASSTGTYADQCNWVTTQSATEGVITTAGVVVSNSIPAAGNGQIAIRGVVPVLHNVAVTASTAVGTSNATAGYMADFPSGSTDQCILGYAINTTVIDSGIPETGYVFVNPSLNYD